MQRLKCPKCHYDVETTLQGECPNCGADLLNTSNKAASIRIARGSAIPLVKFVTVFLDDDRIGRVANGSELVESVVPGNHVLKIKAGLFTDSFPFVASPGSRYAWQVLYNRKSVSLLTMAPDDQPTHGAVIKPILWGIGAIIAMIAIGIVLYYVWR